MPTITVTTDFAVRIILSPIITCITIFFASERCFGLSWELTHLKPAYTIIKDPTAPANITNAS